MSGRELREFKTPDPCLLALQNRPTLVVAALTIARAFALAGFPREHPPLGSFPDWSKWVRDALIWLGRADPVAAMDEVRGEDPKLIALSAVVEQWSRVIGDRRFTAREAAEAANQRALSGGLSYPDFREALLAIANEAGEINARRLGRWLGEVKGRETGGERLEAAGERDGLGLWQLRVLNVRTGDEKG